MKSILENISTLVYPKELRKQCKQSVPPFDILKIVEQIGARAYAGDFDYGDGENASGSIRIEQGVPIIYVNKMLPRDGQRFVLAHMLGHILLGHFQNDDEEWIENASRFSTQRGLEEERNADAFAFELLMPSEWVQDALAAKIVKAEDLALMFGVSEETMRTRLIGLGR
mgnify:CR=1 FL=1